MSTTYYYHLGSTEYMEALSQCNRLSYKSTTVLTGVKKVKKFNKHVLYFSISITVINLTKCKKIFFVK